MKIFSWNVNSVKARKEHVLSFLEKELADVAFLQELKTDGEHYPIEEINSLGYHSEIKGQKGYAGVATLVKDGIDYKLISKILMNEEEQARFVEIDVNGVRMINIYAPNGNPYPSEKYDYKVKFYSALEEKVKTYLEEEKAFLIGGDFNIIPEDKDCFSPDVWAQDALFTDEMRKLYRRWLNYGLVDAFRVFDQRAEQYSFWDYQAGCWPQNKGIRIDHFLLSPEVADRLSLCRIDSEPRGLQKPSDHTPIIIEI